MGHFAMAGGTFTARQLGHACVKWSVDSTLPTLKAINKNAQFKVPAAIARAPGYAQLHLVPFNVAAYYTHAASVLEVPEGTRIEFVDGISEGFENMKDAQGNAFGTDLVTALLKRVHLYSHALHNELVTRPKDPDILILGAGPSAALIARQIAKEYGLEKVLEDNALEDHALQFAFVAHGFGFMGLLKTELRLTFAP